MGWFFPLLQDLRDMLDVDDAFSLHVENGVVSPFIDERRVLVVLDDVVLLLQLFSEGFDHLGHQTRQFQAAAMASEWPPDHKTASQNHHDRQNT